MSPNPQETADLVTFTEENLMENFIFCAAVLEKLKNSLFEIPIIPQTLNINNYRTTSAKSINLHIIRKFIEYSLKTFLSKQYLVSPFLRYCCSK